MESFYLMPNSTTEQHNKLTQANMHSCLLIWLVFYL